ncbi:MAG: DoxX family membrane protein [Candidatus Neomarinimicrobiota bacterium]|nr:MAG: DoxX family membrane protein [Candidatus Neomarinimicrobiota bacterium]
MNIHKPDPSSATRLDWGLFLLRVIFGLSFILYGSGKLLDGPERWTALGQMGPGSLGIHVLPAFWGFLAAASEFGGGLCLLLGICDWRVLIFPILTLAVAIGFHLVSGKGSPWHALETMSVFVTLSLTGSGALTFFHLETQT